MTAMLLLSGGVDSIALAYEVQPSYAITIDYGQRPADAEIRASTKITDELGIAHIIQTVRVPNLGSGDLAERPALPMSPASEWWPFRNQLLLTVAGMHAVEVGVDKLILGTVRSDDFHRDGTKTFVDAMSRCMEHQEGAVTVLAPAIDITSEELVRRSAIPSSLLMWSHSCHTSNYACGQCRGCKKHMDVIYNAGMMERE